MLEDTIIKPLITKTVLSSLLAVSSLALTSCGFHLRGFDTPMTYSVGSTVLRITENTTSFPLKRPLKRKLDAVGVQVVDDIGRQINLSDELYTASIEVTDVGFKRYELVGVLTEVRLVLSANVTYKTLQNSDGKSGTPITVTNPIQVESSYQFNEASVSVEDQQGKQVRQWLYDSLAQRITDQYVALSLPRVSAKAVSKRTVSKPTASSSNTLLTPQYK